MGFKSASELLDELEGGRAASAEGQSVSGDGTCGVVFVCGRCALPLPSTSFVDPSHVAVARTPPGEEARRTACRVAHARSIGDHLCDPTLARDARSRSPLPARDAGSFTDAAPRALLPPPRKNLAAAPRWTTRCATVCSA